MGRFQEIELEMIMIVILSAYWLGYTESTLIPASKSRIKALHEEAVRS